MCGEDAALCEITLTTCFACAFPQYRHTIIPLATTRGSDSFLAVVCVTSASIGLYCMYSIQRVLKYFKTVNGVPKVHVGVQPMGGI